MGPEDQEVFRDTWPAMAADQYRSATPESQTEMEHQNVEQQ